MSDGFRIMYKRTGKIIILYILILPIYDGGEKTKLHAEF
jgi:hypothetical protein